MKQHLKYIASFSVTGKKMFGGKKTNWIEA